MSIAEQIIARAQAYGAAHTARMTTPPPTSTRLAQPGPVTSREETVRRMADAMRDIGAVKGSVEEADLLNRGWSAQAIASYGADARDLANAAAERRS